MKITVAVLIALIMIASEVPVAKNILPQTQLFGASKALAYYGAGRRIARRTARRTARRVVRRHHYYGHSRRVYGPPIAAAGIAIGTTVVALPGGCRNLIINGATYYECGGTYYQPAYNGPNLVYIVVAPPR